MRKWIDGNPGGVIAAAALLGLGLAIFTPYVICQFNDGLCAVLKSDPPWTIFPAVAAAPSILLTWWWRTVRRAEELRNSSTRLAVERFAGGVGLTNEDVLTLRLAGILSLRELASDTESYRRPVVETLAALVRSRVPIEHGKRKPSPLEDVNLALESIVTIRGLGAWEDRDGLLNLSHLDLGHQVLAGDWSHTNFDCSAFPVGSTIEADLSGCSFILANLEGCDLSKALMKNVKTEHTQLSWAKLPAAFAELMEIELDDNGEAGPFEPGVDDRVS